MKLHRTKFYEPEGYYGDTLWEEIRSTSALNHISSKLWNRLISNTRILIEKDIRLLLNKID